jgi:NAD(P)-dependent dehydrogenase (short-subunit alcohol dehydrogenase family)
VPFFVFGASRGIGRSAASTLAHQGAHVVFGCKDPKTVSELSADLNAVGSHARAVMVDAQHSASIESAHQETKAFAGGISTLVYNAGVIDPIAPFRDIAAEDWERIVSTNLLGAARAVRLALPYFTNPPRIIFLSSGAARQAIEGWSAYCVSKAGLSMLMKALALELGSEAFVCALSPGMVDTAMQASIRASGEGAISAVARIELTPVDVVGETLAALAVAAPRALHGRDVSLTEARAALGMSKIKTC